MTYDPAMNPARTAGTVRRPETSADRPQAVPRRRRVRRPTLGQRLARHAYPVFMFCLGIAVASCFLNLKARTQTRDYGRELRYASYTVKSGDTMWGIAVDMAAANPEFNDVRQYLTLLQKTNRNYGDYLPAGSEIMIPYYAVPDKSNADGRQTLEDTIMGTYARYGIIDDVPWTDILGG